MDVTDLKAGIKISIHAPRVGCDNRPTCIRWRDKHFNPRTPGGVRLLEQFELLRRVHISIHAPRVGCDGVRGVESCGNHISIHAPRVGCDAVYILHDRDLWTISIHAPRVGCDL